MSKSAGELKKEIENLEIEKDSLENYISKKSKEVEAVQKKFSDLSEAYSKEIAEMNKKRSEFKEIEMTSQKIAQENSVKRNSLDGEFVRLEEEKKSLRETADNLRQREGELEGRIKLLLDREKYVKEVFLGLEKLKGK